MVAAGHLRPLDSITAGTVQSVRLLPETGTRLRRRIADVTLLTRFGVRRLPFYADTLIEVSNRTPTRDTETEH